MPSIGILPSSCWTVGLETHIGIYIMQCLYNVHAMYMYICACVCTIYDEIIMPIHNHIYAY